MKTIRRLALLFRRPISVPTKLSVDSWWDAANPFGNKTLPSDTDPISSIIDLGRRGNNLVQTDPALRPTYDSDVLNGQPGFIFTGTQQLIRLSSASNNYVGPMTIIAVAATASNTVTARILNKGSFNGGSGGGWGAGRSTSAYQYTCYTVKDYNSGLSQWVLNTPQIATYRLNDDRSANFFKNGVSAGSSAAAGSFPPATLTPLLFGGGTIDTTDQFWRGTILTVFWFWRALNASELTAMHNYCKKRFGIA